MLVLNKGPRQGNSLLFGRKSFFFFHGSTLHCALGDDVASWLSAAGGEYLSEEDLLLGTAIPAPYHPTKIYAGNIFLLKKQ